MVKKKLFQNIWNVYSHILFALSHMPIPEPFPAVAEGKQRKDGLRPGLQTPPRDLGVVSASLEAKVRGQTGCCVEGNRCSYGRRVNEC